MTFSFISISLLHLQFTFLIDIHTECNRINDIYPTINSSLDIFFTSYDIKYIFL